MLDDNPMPHRAVRLQLDLEADTLDELINALDGELGERIEGWTTAIEKGQAPDDVDTSIYGGTGPSWHLQLTHNPAQTPDEFAEALAAWSTARRTASLGTENVPAGNEAHHD